MIDGPLLAVLFWVIFLASIEVPIVNIAIGIIACSLYGAVTESSAAQASLGKRALGLKVTDLQGKRISFGQAFGRWILKGLLVVSIIGNFGFLVVAFTEKKQGVHDLIAGTIVRRAH